MKDSTGFLPFRPFCLSALSNFGLTSEKCEINYLSSVEDEKVLLRIIIIIIIIITQSPALRLDVRNEE